MVKNPIVVIKAVLGIGAGLYAYWHGDWRIGTVYLLVGAIDFIMSTVQA